MSAASSSLGGRAVAASSGASRPPGVVRTLAAAIAQEGLLAPYKGLMLSLPGVVIYTSVSFSTYDELKVGCRGFMSQGMCSAQLQVHEE